MPSSNNRQLSSRPAFYDAATMQELTDNDVQDIIATYPDYKTGQAYKAGDTFKYDGKAYGVIQAHTSQKDWPPDTTRALYNEIAPEQVIAPWKQPTGAHDAYKKGDRVTYKEKIYESTIDANVWSPEAYPAGWKVVN